jgi:hypothetical protein
VGKIKAAALRRHPPAHWFAMQAYPSGPGPGGRVHQATSKYAGAEQEIFSDVAVDEIYRFSSGAARLVNKACTLCLLYGAQNGRRNR